MAILTCNTAPEKSWRKSSLTSRRPQASESASWPSCPSLLSQALRQSWPSAGRALRPCLLLASASPVLLSQRSTHCLAQGRGTAGATGGEWGGHARNRALRPPHKQLRTYVCQQTNSPPLRKGGRRGGSNDPLGPYPQTSPGDRQGGDSLPGESNRVSRLKDPTDEARDVLHQRQEGPPVVPGHVRA